MDSTTYVGPLLLVGALFYDRLVGERPLCVHPSIIFGRILAFFDSRRSPKRHGAVQFFQGIVPLGVMASASICTVYVLVAISSIEAPYAIATVCAAAATIFLLKATFAIRSMEECTRPILDALGKDDMENARLYVSYIVSRPTDDLDKNEIISATVECVGESIVDGIVAPVSYYALFGIGGALVYRSVNTADSMIGYMSEKYRYYGKAAARLDDILNFIPTRIAVIFTIIAAQASGLDVQNGLRIMWRDSKITKSPNAGLTMALYAGLLNVRLEKKDHYSLGDEGACLTADTVDRALALMRATSYIYIIVCAVLMAILSLPIFTL